MKYSKNIYPKQIVVRAIKAYEELSRIEMTENEKYWILEFFDCFTDEKLLVNEFGNYLIEAANGADGLV